MVKFKKQVSGIDRVQRNLGTKAAKDLTKAIHVDINEGVSEMAELSYDYAPVDTGALRASILASVQRQGPMEFIYGSTLPYAQRQEYEHKTKNAFFRRAIWAKTPEIQDKIGFTIKRKTNG